MRSCVLTSAATRKAGFGTNVNSSVKECAGGDDDCARTEASPFKGLDAEHSLVVRGKQQPSNSPLHGTQVFMLFEQRPYCASVQPAITLSPWRPYRWTLAPIEHSELEHREIRSSSHYSAKSVYLAYDGSLRNSADSRVARHLADRFERTSDETHSGTQTSCGNRGFGSGVTGPD